MVNESSVSRSHARLILARDDSLFLVDSSKFGSFVNGSKVLSNAKVELRHGDFLQLGVHGFKMHLRHLQWTVCFTLISSAQKAALASQLEAIGPTAVR